MAAFSSSPSTSIYVYVHPCLCLFRAYLSKEIKQCILSCGVRVKRRKPFQLSQISIHLLHVQWELNTVQYRLRSCWEHKDPLGMVNIFTCYVGSTTRTVWVELTDANSEQSWWHQGEGGGQAEQGRPLPHSPQLGSTHSWASAAERGSQPQEFSALNIIHLGLLHVTRLELQPHHLINDHSF